MEGVQSTGERAKMSGSVLKLSPMRQKKQRNSRSLQTRTGQQTHACSPTHLQRTSKGNHARTCFGLAATGNRSIVKNASVFLFPPTINSSLFSQSICRRGGRKGQTVIAQNTHIHQRAHTHSHTHREETIAKNDEHGGVI